MAYQDSDAERRNLMLTSIGFILYYTAGGQFLNNEITFQVVNLSFDKPLILTIAAWMILFWFLLRYWQTHRDSVFHAFRQDTKDAMFDDLRDYLSHYVGNIINKTFEKDEGFVLYESESKVGTLSCDVRYKIARNIIKRNDGTVQSYSPIKEGSLHLSDSLGILLRITSIIIACIKYKTFSSYMVPYILFILAVLIPLIRCIRYYN